MFKNINPEKIVKSDQFVREPVSAVTKKIANSSSKKIILNGGKGAGKSVILQNLEYKNLDTENQTIYTKFDRDIKFAKNPDEYYDSKFFNHYFEMELCLKLLSYIRTNYSLLFEANFQEFYEQLSQISKRTFFYINNRVFKEQKLDSYLEPFEISTKIIERLKKVLGIDTLNIAIDRFDWTKGTSEYSQKALSNYFDLFDKTIVTTDDEDIDEQELVNKGYSFVKSDYGYDRNVIKEIIKRRIKAGNERIEYINLNRNIDDQIKKFDASRIDEKIYDIVSENCDGDISLTIDAVGDYMDVLSVNGDKIENLDEKLDSIIKNRKARIMQLKNFDANPPKLYL